MRPFVFFCLGFLFILPAVVFAQLVPCDGPECQACHLVELGDNIVRFLITIAAVIGAIMIAVAGLQMVTSGGDVARVTAAKNTMTNVVIGFIILLAAWLLVDTIMKAFVNESKFGVWNQIECVELPQYENEPPPLPECANFIDDDGDGLTDGEDPHCVSGYHEDGRDPQCSDGINNNDGDDLVDAADPDCHYDGNPNNPQSYDPSDDSEYGESNVGPPQCDDDQALMERYGGSPVGLEAPGLRDMINCYLGDLDLAEAVDMNQIYTVDRSHPRCSLTNGNTVCGPCSHSNNSCHYGRGSGEGAKAVDFNARSGFSESELYRRIQVRQVQCGGRLIFEGSHTHISMPGC